MLYQEGVLQGLRVPGVREQVPMADGWHVRRRLVAEGRAVLLRAAHDRARRNYRHGDAAAVLKRGTDHLKHGKQWLFFAAMRSFIVDVLDAARVFVRVPGDLRGLQVQVSRLRLRRDLGAGVGAAGRRRGAQGLQREHHAL